MKKKGWKGINVEIIFQISGKYLKKMYHSVAQARDSVVQATIIIWSNLLLCLVHTYMNVALNIFFHRQNIPARSAVTFTTFQFCTNSMQVKGTSKSFNVLKVYNKCIAKNL